MRHTRGRVVVVESLTEFDRRYAAGARSLTGWRLRGLDLSERSAELARCDTSRTTFVGCTFAPGEQEQQEAVGALVLPDVHQAPVDPHRAELYEPEELYDVTPYERSLDARAYAWQQCEAEPDALLAQALHDHGIDAALGRWREGRRLVGVMGGHAALRGDRTYVDAARLGRLLGSQLTVATGGGPGAMEAANLGARLAAEPRAMLDAAIGALSRVRSFHPSIDEWVGVALDVAHGTAHPTPNLGVPTWHYGHEPPNVFATAVAKYFRNAQREAILLELCNAGIVFLPGAGGTVQEIFQDACENYYAEEHSVAPMVLVGSSYWTEAMPAWPLLEALARGRAMERHVHLVDTVEEAAALLTGRGRRPEPSPPARRDDGLPGQAARRRVRRPITSW